MTLELKATPEEVMRAVESLREFASERGVKEPDLFALSLALEESACNVVNHALQRDPTQKFQVKVEHKGNEVVIELRDHGPAFDPTQSMPRNPDDHEREGGWGLEFVKRYSDEICYCRESGENVLRLTRRLGAARDAKHFPETNKK